MSDYGVTGRRSKVVHVTDRPHPTAVCHRRRFLVLTGMTWEQVEKSFPDRRLCRGCERVSDGGSET